MIIRNCMKVNVFYIPATATVQEAIQSLVSHHIGLLPVVDTDHRPVGVVGLKDLLMLALPSGFHLLKDIDFIGDFGAMEQYRPSEGDLHKPITALMRTAAIVREDSGLLRAYALMLQHDLHDIVVVDQNGRLSGIASRVDLGTTILKSWESAT